MKVTYLSQYASTSRVGMIVPITEIEHGECFEAIDDHYWYAGRAFRRDKMRVTELHEPDREDSTRGFWNNQDPDHYKYKTLVRIIERTP